MRFLAGALGIVCGALMIAAAARFGFATSDKSYNWSIPFGAVTFACLFGHALAARLWRDHKVASLPVFAASASVLIISLSNTLGSLTGRVNEAEAARIQIAGTVHSLTLSLERAE